MTADIKFYLSILRRRLPIIIAILLPAMVSSYYIAQQLPTTYQASARLLLESASIPDELTALGSGDRSRERMEIVQQRLLTRANLLDIAEDFRVFDPDAQMSPDAIVAAMNRATTIRISSGRNRATVMNIRFEGRRAQMVADVVNEYVTRILREDADLRQGQARQTEEFFQQEVDRLSDELDLKSAAISAFRSENSDALPETFQFRLNRLGTLQERSANLTQEVLLLTEQRRQFAETLAAFAGDSTSEQLTVEQKKLAQLREELAQAMELGGETAPRVRILRSRILQVEQVIASLGGNAVGLTSPAERLADQIAQIDTQLAFLQNELRTIEEDLAEIEATNARTPAISIALEDLERDFLNTQQQYNTVVGRLAVAETTERIELLSRGERISILDPATVPNQPFKPDRRQVMIAGSGAGLLLAIGLVLAFEFFNPVVKRPSTITKTLGITPIATLPYIRSNREMWTDRIMRIAVLCFVFIGVPAAFWLLHTFYLPLDLIAEKVLDRLGV
ncbi:GumC family protein [Tropicimonas sp. S265A]|uniref:GumC family protein n=1 Tax=Tropicimonas sp. S265A TaxID=3415134 RepID=UPI003C7CAC7C